MTEQTESAPGRLNWKIIPVLLLICPLLHAQDSGQNAAPAKDPTWSTHYQSTLIGQGALPFPAGYSGPNSLENHGEIRDTVSFDLTVEAHLWQGGGIFVDVLVWQGYGLSKTTGVAGFPNGEAYRLGKTYPDAIISRAFLRHTISFNAGGDRGPDSQAPGSSVEKKLVLTVGHFPSVDIFDKNAYANDPRTQFMNWALVNNTAWDYPANTIGTTNGAAAELSLGSWTARAGLFQVSCVANGITLDWNLEHAWSVAGELEKRHSFGGHPGAVRLLAYDTHAHMGNYQAALGTPESLSFLGQSGYHSKYGFGINLEQEIRNGVGVFARLGWNDGRNQTYEFTDVDREVSSGISLTGELWRRPKDTVGVAAVVNGISAVHRQFLANGGLGVTVGDGQLNYGTERIVEAYYSFATRWGMRVSPDFQFVGNPAYNRDRGPVPIYAVRFHWEK